MNILDDKVLLLNRLMQSLGTISVRRAFFLLTKPRRNHPTSKVATALEINGAHEIVRHVPWDEWIQLPVREGDRFITTGKQRIRVPSIITLAEFDRLPVVDPLFNKRSLWERQKGLDMYSAKPLVWHECDIDHYIAQSAGGETSWTNCGLTAIKTNRLKGNRRAEEVGLKLCLPLFKPPPKPVFRRMTSDSRFPEWEPFMAN